jgi:hypothetical protein
MKTMLVITFVLSTVLIANGWTIGEDPLSPSAAYLEFHRLVLAGDATASKAFLSANTLNTLDDLSKSLAKFREMPAALAKDPYLSRLNSDLMSDMHISKDASNNDIWSSIIAEAAEFDTEPYMTMAITITSEEMHGDKACVTIEAGSFICKERLVREDGKWKVDHPYVCVLAAGGWQLDLANYFAKMEALQSLTRKTGVNVNKTEVSVREVVRK